MESWTEALNYDLLSILPSLLNIEDQYGGANFWEEAVPCQIPDAVYISIERGLKLLSCVRLPGSPTRFCSICGKIRCDKRKKSYDTFNSETECVYGRDHKCKEECSPMCFEGKIFHLSRVWIVSSVEQAHWDHVKIIHLHIWARQVNEWYWKNLSQSCLTVDKNYYLLRLDCRFVELVQIEKVYFNIFFQK